MAFVMNKRVQQQFLQDLELSPTELDRRERNRSKVRRSYYRKIYNLTELRAQVAALEAKYEQLLAAASERESEAVEEEVKTTGTELAKTDVTTVDRVPKPATLSLLQLARVRKALYQENEELRDKHMEVAKAHASLQHLLDVSCEDDALDTSDVADSQLLIVRRFTLEECLEVGRTAYRRIAAYLDAQRNVPPPRTAMGWADRRQYADGELSYCFSKLFPRRQATELAAKTWNILSSPKTQRKNFSHYLNIKFHIVQQLDVNNIIFFRTINQTGQEAVLKGLFLLTRFETDRGVLLVTQSLDPSHIEDDFVTVDMIGKAECWQDFFSWMLMEDDTSGNACRVSYGGVDRAKDPHNVFWGIEVLLFILRWETTVVSPLFTLRCN